MGELPAPFSAAGDVLKYGYKQGIGGTGVTIFAVILPASIP